MEATELHIDVEGPLNEVIKHLYCIQTPETFDPVVQHLSPNLEMMLIFNFGEPVRSSFADEELSVEGISRVAVVGPLRRMLKYEILPKTDLIVIVFNMDGFYRLFQLPMDQISGDEILDPDLLLKVSGFSKLWEELKNLESLHERVELLKMYGLAFVQNAEDAITPLLQGISYFNGAFVQPVRAIAMDSDLSERTIQLRFRKYLGYSPKELLRFIRFKKVIADILNKKDNEIDWFGLIEEFGYHDQSHLIKDFHHYLGTTPQKFVKDILGKEFCVSKEGKYYS